uniref:Uncharacterized protein n=1 Tax=Triticum urartu TaxID=4572 RepID=A0A8R7V0C0_TRIUA
MSTLLFFHCRQPPAMDVDMAKSRLAPARNPSTRFLCCSCCTERDGASALRAQCPLPMRCASTFTMRLEQPPPTG